MASSEREGIAQRYEFKSFEELLDSSKPLPMLPEEGVQRFVARDRYGRLFVWNDICPGSTREQSRSHSDCTS